MSSNSILLFFIEYLRTNPKSYFAIDHDSEKSKRSSKGVQHRVKLTYEEYKETVYKSREREVENSNIRLHNGRMTTLKMQKTGLKNVFVKAFVDDDLITVKPFNKFI